MYLVEQTEFEEMVQQSIQKVPEPYKGKINNIAFLVDDEPNEDQRKRLGLRPCQSLFGLYEGVPLPARNGYEGNMLPDRITIFKKPHEMNASSQEDLKKQITNTVWHEVAHYFGLNHKRIYELEAKIK